MARRQRPLADQLRQAIRDSAMTLYKLSKESSVHRSQLSRFMRGERDLGLDIADKVCHVLGLQLTRTRITEHGGPSATKPELAKKKTRNWRRN